MAGNAEIWMRSRPDVVARLSVYTVPSSSPSHMALVPISLPRQNFITPNTRRDSPRLDQTMVVPRSIGNMALMGGELGGAR